MALLFKTISIILSSSKSILILAGEKKKSWNKTEEIKMTKR
jgi:hypothetical protein